VSTVRLSVPIGIGGTPLIIRTSLIKEEDGAPNMQAIIDLGCNVLHLPTIQQDVPLRVDVTGQLVIAVDEYPATGWPPGLMTRVDLYPGAIFTNRVQRHQHRDAKSFAARAAKSCSWPQLQSG
ncbi:unnamed protein product, partial [Durusdinium trenchii]